MDVCVQGWKVGGEENPDLGPRCSSPRIAEGPHPRDQGRRWGCLGAGQGRRNPQPWPLSSVGGLYPGSRSRAPMVLFFLRAPAAAYSSSPASTCWRLGNQHPFQAGEDFLCPKRGGRDDTFLQTPYPSRGFGSIDLVCSSLWI